MKERERPSRALPLSREADPECVADFVAPWGTYLPRRGEAVLIRLTRALPPIQPAAALALLLRRRMKYRGETPLDTELWGLKLRLARRGSVSESRMLFTPQLFDRRERHAVLHRLAQGDTFVDAGANAGGYSFWVHHRFPGSVAILAVEPDREMAKRIQFNAATNDARRVRVAMVALSDEDGSGTFLIDGRNRGENALLPRGAGQPATGDATGGAVTTDARGRLVTVPVRTLLSLLREEGVASIGVLKIDIEGHEHGVLAHFFTHAEPALYPRSIVFEMKPTPTHRALLALLERHGYRAALRTRRNIIMDRPGGAE